MPASTKPEKTLPCRVVGIATIFARSKNRARYARHCCHVSVKIPHLTFMPRSFRAGVINEVARLKRPLSNFGRHAGAANWYPVQPNDPQHTSTQTWNTYNLEPPPKRKRENSITERQCSPASAMPPPTLRYSNASM